MDTGYPIIAEKVQKQADSLVAGDVAALGDLFDDTLVWTHSSGKIDNKESFLAPFRAGPSRYRAFDPVISKVRPFGDVTLVHGVVGITSQTGDVVRSISNLFIAVWTRSGDDWKLSAWQSTRQPENTN